tara:strand:+ start:178 stop:378 length:201 start_codon:yes stop_codon:yes gene_type:complete
MKTNSNEEIKHNFTNHYVRDDVEKKVDIIELNRRLNQNNKLEQKANLKLVLISVVGLTAFGVITIL